MPTALITGASGGIGYELARLFAKDHYELVLVARSEDKLQQSASNLQRDFKTLVRTFAMDLTQAPAPQLLFQHLQQQRITVDCLVNNAGYGKQGAFAQISLQDNLGQIQLNIAALTELTQLFLPPMLERRRGKILNVASTAGFQPGPMMAVYYATKAYVISFSEALANEVSDSGVTVTCLCPGATDTNFQVRAGTEDSILFRKLRPMQAEAVARDGYSALMSGKSLTVSGFRNWLLTESQRFAPRKLVIAISRKLLDQSR